MNTFQSLKALEAKVNEALQSLKNHPLASMGLIPVGIEKAIVTQVDGDNYTVTLLQDNGDPSSVSKDHVHTYPPGSTFEVDDFVLWMHQGDPETGFILGATGAGSGSSTTGVGIANRFFSS